MGDIEDLRLSILAQVAEYYEKAHHNRPFEPGQTTVHYAGRVFDAKEALASITGGAKGMEGQGVDLMATARYVDRHEKRNGEWRIAHRSVVTAGFGSSRMSPASVTMEA